MGRAHPVPPLGTQELSHSLSLDGRWGDGFTAQGDSSSAPPGLLSSCSHLQGPEELLFGDHGGLLACGDGKEGLGETYTATHQGIQS